MFMIDLHLRPVSSFCDTTFFASDLAFTRAIWHLFFGQRVHVYNPWL
jgi:hypothetical protein